MHISLSELLHGTRRSLWTRLNILGQLFFRRSWGNSILWSQGNCSFSTPSTSRQACRYTHVCGSHIHNTHRAAGRYFKQSTLLYLLYNHHGTQQINWTNQL